MSVEPSVQVTRGSMPGGPLAGPTAGQKSHTPWVTASCAVLVWVALASTQPIFAQSLPPNFQNEIVLDSGLNAPTAIEFLPDGSLLITEFGGRIKMVPPGGTQVNPTPVLTLSNVFQDVVDLGGERGLVSIVADPSFATNHFIYVFYTANSPQRDRVSRFTLIGATADPASELVVWQGKQNSSSTDHHGGWVAFGPDGKLYISTGDNGDPQSSQSLTSDHGKILRVNKDGTVPTDNPFFDGTGPNVDAIWALGLRNPYRFSFDMPTGRMYIGDVGFNTTEEINLGAVGANYGWPVCEGECSSSGMTNPIFTYPHAGGSSAVTAGFVYRGTQFPSQYQGVFFFGDYVRSWIKYLTLDGNGLPTDVDFFQPTDGEPGGPYGLPVCIRQGPDGAMYYVDIGVAWGGALSAPTIRRIRYIAQNQLPLVISTANPTSGLPPLSVSFSSAGSYDPEGQALAFLWSFGDGGTSTLPNPTHVYNQAGPYWARLSVSDGTNTALGSSILVAVGRPPVPGITSPATGSFFQGGDTISFSGSATDPDDGNLPPNAFSWTILFHHETHIHPGGTFNGATSGAFLIPVSGHDFSGNTFYEILLTVTDSSGLASSTSVSVYPRKVNLSFQSSPSGLQLNIDGIPFVTPFVKDALINFRHTIEAPNQSLGGNSYVFGSWSDGGAQSHEYPVPATPQSLTANFTTGQPPVPPGLVAGYGFGEGSGTSAVDSSGNGHTGAISGASWSTQGKFGNALSFNGTNNLVTINSTSLLNLTTGMTLEAWVFPTTSNGTRDILIKEGSNVDIYNLYARNWRGLPEANVYAGGANRTAEGTVLPANVWTHVAATYNGSTVRLYVNGVQVAATAFSGSITTSTGPLRIGGNSLWGEYFQGLIDEVRVYNRALSQAEIQADMNNPVVPAGPDSTAPVRSNGQPSGMLPTGTTQATLSLSTNENATCRYSTTAGVAYSSMTGMFTTTGALGHSTTVNGLSDGGNYSFFVRCQDTSNNANTSDFAINFSVTLDTTPPVRSGGQPSGMLPAGTAQTTLSLATDENATCRYSTTAGVAYGSMTGTFASTGALTHSTTVNGLSGGNYSFFVRCQDSSNNANTNDFAISFAVALDTTPPIRSNPQPAGALPAGTTQTTLNLTTNENAACRYSTTPGVAYGSMTSTFTTTGALTHSTPVSGLSNGSNYTFFVRCQDYSSNPDLDDFPISFSVAMPTTTVAAFPGSTTLLTGTVNAGTFAALASDNNVYYAVDSTTSGTRTSAWYGSFNGVARTLSNLRVSYSGNNSRNTTQTISIWSWSTGAWVQLDSRTVGTAEVAINNLVPAGTLASYVSGSGASGEVRVRVQCQTTANFINRGDLMSLVYDVPIGIPPPDTLPPVRSNGQPSGTLPSGTTQATLSLTTDENATCRYSTTAGVAYGSMTSTFATTGGLSHSMAVNGLANGGTYTLYVRCQDGAGNANTGDFTISFAVAQPSGLPPGLVAAYGMNEGSGTSVADATGNGQTGAISGAAWSPQGKFGNALSFNGTSNVVTVNSTALLNLSTGMTLEAWVFATTNTGARDVLIKEGTSVDIYNLYARNWRGLPEANVYAGGANRTAEGAALTANVWTHMAATYDGSMVRLFINGVQVASAAFSGSITSSTAPLRIGGNSLWGEYFQGRIDEVRIYNRALSQSEIQSDMNTPITP